MKENAFSINMDLLIERLFNYINNHTSINSCKITINVTQMIPYEIELYDINNTNLKVSSIEHPNFFDNTEDKNILLMQANIKDVELNKIYRSLHQMKTLIPRNDTGLLKYNYTRVIEEV